MCLPPMTDFEFRESEVDDMRCAKILNLDVQTRKNQLHTNKHEK